MGGTTTIVITSVRNVEMKKPKVSLRDYLEERIQSLSNRVDAAAVASEKALEKATSATEKRFDSVNEFRAVLSDQTSTLLPRSEYDARHQALTDRTEANAARIASLDAKLTGHREGTGSVGTVIMGALIALNSLAAVAAVLISVLHR